MAPALTSIREIEREMSSLRAEPGTSTPIQRTSVMTHTAWVPEEWVEAAEDVLSGLAERHPSRTIVLIPQPDEAELEGIGCALRPDDRISAAFSGDLNGLKPGNHHHIAERGVFFARQVKRDCAAAAGLCAAVVAGPFTDEKSD